MACTCWTPGGDAAHAVPQALALVQWRRACCAMSAAASFAWPRRSATSRKLRSAGRSRASTACRRDSGAAGPRRARDRHSGRVPTGRVGDDQQHRLLQSLQVESAGVRDVPDPINAPRASAWAGHCCRTRFIERWRFPGMPVSGPCWSAHWTRCASWADRKYVGCASGACAPHRTAHGVQHCCTPSENRVYPASAIKTSAGMPRPWCSLRIMANVNGRLRFRIS